jgi:TRAP transporter TAXI family solute receptor
MKPGLKGLGWLTIVAILAGCSGQGGEPVQNQRAPKQEPVASAPAEQKITLATATKGGVFWPMGEEIAAIWNDKVTGVTTTAINTGGTADNIQKLGFGELQVGFAVSGVVFDAVNGVGEYKVAGPQKELRGLGALHPNVIHILVREGADVKSLVDLKGRAYGPGAERSATEINTREILEVIGLETAAMKNYYLPYDKTVEAMNEKRLDGATLAAGVGGKAIKDALALGNWNVLPLSQAEVDAVVAKYPSYFPFTIPADTYAGQKEPILTLAQASILIARADLPDEAAYQFVKALYENLPRLTAKVSAAASITKENALKGISGVVPLHPGAAKYYKEIGIHK